MALPQAALRSAFPSKGAQRPRETLRTLPLRFPSLRWPGRCRGYTLVELLVVMVLLGVAAGAVTVSVSPSEERRVTEELTRLGALFRLAQDEARVSGRTVVWEADTDGYRFRRGDPATTATTDDPLRPRRWPFGVIRLDAPIVVFGREPLLEPATIRIASRSREWRIDIDPLGRVSLVQ